MATQRAAAIDLLKAVDAVIPTLPPDQRPQLENPFKAFRRAGGLLEEGLDQEGGDENQTETLEAENARLAAENARLAAENARLAAENARLATDNATLTANLLHQVTLHRTTSSPTLPVTIGPVLKEARHLSKPTILGGTNSPTHKLALRRWGANAKRYIIDAFPDHPVEDHLLELGNLLTGEPRAWLDVRHDHPWSSIGEVIDRLVVDLTDPNEYLGARAEWASATPGPTESMHSFATRLESIGARCVPPKRPSDIYDRFIDVLGPLGKDIEDELLKVEAADVRRQAQFGRAPPTLDPQDKAESDLNFAKTMAENKRAKPSSKPSSTSTKTWPTPTLPTTSRASASASSSPSLSFAERRRASWVRNAHNFQANNKMENKPWPNVGDGPANPAANLCWNCAQRGHASLLCSNARVNPADVPLSTFERQGKE